MHEVYALWLRGRANGVMIAFGRPVEPLSELARQAAAAITLADRYTDAFALAQRRKQPKAAAEIQQSLLPPRISRITRRRSCRERAAQLRGRGGLVRRGRERRWGLGHSWRTASGGSTRAAASSAVALGALRASRRSGGEIGEALIVMHQTLREMPGPRAEMTAVVARWEPASAELRVANCGHVAPVILRDGGEWSACGYPRTMASAGVPAQSR